jgi:hypothetical protein
MIRYGSGYLPSHAIKPFLSARWSFLNVQQSLDALLAKGSFVKIFHLPKIGNF